MSLRERAIIVGAGLKTDNRAELKESLAELADLTETAGGEVVATVFQILENWVSATLIGSGKIQEIKDLVIEHKAKLVIVDHELGGAQTRNLETLLGARVLDRTQLILDIFAMRAQSHEGKLQVELAQLLDQSSRMVGAWHGSLSRQGGGIGTRGPGESAIEVDRRVMRDRITRIRRDLDHVSENRKQHRLSRKRKGIPSFALIGYTNVGKSTLLNKLTNSDVYVENKVFATLDPTSRRVYLPDAPEAIITDTVGYIRKLPTKLIEAFKATLEETEEADILLHVVDFAHSEWRRQMDVVHELIREFKWDSKPIIHVFNKADIASPERKFQVKEHPRVFISATTGLGIDQLKEEMKRAILNLYSEAQLYFPATERHLMYELARDTQITRQEEASTGIVCYAPLTPLLMSKWARYLA